ncbi:MAG TPA: PqqD family protein [Thermoanaerobaculia bacterium]|nr:PqqD family protein [Thermoanaerobaculia bacterium]
MKLKLAPQVAWQVIDGEAVIIDLASGVTIGLNPSGTFIWTKLLEQDDTAAAEAVVSEYGIAREEAAADVAELIATLRERNLVVAPAAGS